MKWVGYHSRCSGGANIARRKLSMMTILILTIVIGTPLLLLNCQKQLKLPEGPDEINFPGSPAQVRAVVDDGSILLTWTMTDTNNVHCYHIYRKDTVAADMSLIDSCFAMTYLDKNVVNGRIYYYQITAVDKQGYESKRSEETNARPNIFDVIIEEGAEYTNKRMVTLKLIAPLGTKYMIIANDSSFSNASWEYYASAKDNWMLSQGDGLKSVYVKFRDSEENENKSLVYDTIILDTRAVINKVLENSNSQVKRPGQVIHFAIITGESEGNATIDIGTARQGIALFDDGTHGDSAALDGKYEIDYQIPSDLEVINAVITGHFTDRVNNVANDATAPGRVTIQRPPSAVHLSLLISSGGAEQSLELSWSQNQDNDFCSYRLFRSTTAGVDTSSLLLTTITDRTTTRYNDSDVKEDTTYYYKVFVYDNYGLNAASNEVQGKINHNEPPTPVTLYPINPIGNSTTSLNLSWSANQDVDFASYKIYRSDTAGVNNATARLITTITDQNTTGFDDTGLQQDTEYYYRVYVYDTDGLSAGSNERKGKTNANEPPQPVTLYTPAPILNSWSALNLNWSRNQDGDFASYKIYRSDTAGLSNATATLITTITDQNTTSFDDTGLQQDTQYHYRIYVYDTGGLFASSNEDSAKTNVNEPPAPVTLFQPLVVDSVTLKLIWTENDEEDFKMYMIYRSESSPVDTTGSAIGVIYQNTVTEYNDSNLEKNKTYFYRVFVTDSEGLSAGSNEVSGTPEP